MSLTLRERCSIEARIDQQYPGDQARANLEKLRLACSPAFDRRLSRRIGHIGQIRLKEGGLGLIVPNASQRKLLAAVARKWRRGEPARIVYLKPRQTGISTITELLIFLSLGSTSNTRACVIAHKRTISVKVLRMFKTAMKYGPYKINPVSNARDIVAFPEPIDSSVDVDSAESDEPGHGDTVQFLHLTEVSRWKDAETKMKGLLQTVPDKPGTLVVIESTANGADGYFYDLWGRATMGESEYVPIFHAWYEHEEYTLPTLSATHRQQIIDTLDEREQFLLTRKYLKRGSGWVNVSLEQLAWRRRTIESKCNHDPDVFDEQYPESIEVAFLSSGRPVFDPRKLRAQMEAAKAPVFRGDIIDREYVPRDEPAPIDAIREDLQVEVTIREEDLSHGQVNDLMRVNPWINTVGRENLRVDPDEDAALYEEAEL